MKQKTKDNLFAILACLGIAAIFGAAAWWAWSGCFAAQESAAEHLERASRRGHRPHLGIFQPTFYLGVLALLLSTVCLAALGVAGYIALSLQRRSHR